MHPGLSRRVGRARAARRRVAFFILPQDAEPPERAADPFAAHATPPAPPVPPAPADVDGAPAAPAALVPNA
jgi:hypothetical protein